MMVKVPSFQVEHTTMKAGLYLRENRRLNLFTKIKVWDLRFVAPSEKRYLSSAALHSIEHIFAFKLREVLGDKYISVFVFGCKSGFGFISKSSLSLEEFRNALIEVIEHTIPVISKSEIPALTEKECGRPTLYCIRDTSTWLNEYLQVLKSMQ